MSNLVSHMRASAEAGNADAQFNLAVILGNGFDDRGRFIGSQREEALTWLRKAANAGLCRAQCKLAQTYAGSDTVEDFERDVRGSWSRSTIRTGEAGLPPERVTKKLFVC